jgi:hypothetical protein
MRGSAGRYQTALRRTGRSIELLWHSWESGKKTVFWKGLRQQSFVSSKKQTELQPTTDRLLSTHIDFFNQQDYPRRDRVARDSCRLKSPVAQ